MEPESCAARVNILAVIDTEYIKSTHQNPSQDMNKPTAIASVGVHTICSGASEIVYKQAGLSFVACHGNTMAFRGISIYNNSEDAVIVYRVKSTGSGHIFKGDIPVLTTRNGAVQPDPDSVEGGIPPVHTKMNFSSLNSTLETSRKESFKVCFALYTLADDGQTQQLFGYFFYRWTLDITVQPENA
ncbi:MAG: AidA/PixA family protein [Gallionella sp.]|jgi:hypothetical protein